MGRPGQQTDFYLVILYLSQTERWDRSPQKGAVSYCGSLNGMTIAARQTGLNIVSGWLRLAEGCFRSSFLISNPRGSFPLLPYS